MDSIEMTTDVYIDVEEFLDKVDDEVLIDYLRENGHVVLSGPPDPNDAEYIAQLTECIIPLVDFFKDDEKREDGIKLVQDVVERVFAFL